MANQPPCDGNDQYKPGGQYSPGSPYCDPCYDPYSGPGFPVGGSGPTAGGCLPDDTDPCALPERQATPCPNTICDTRLSGIATSKRMSLVGIVGKCLYRFVSKTIGFVVSDSNGQLITNRPCIKIPFLKSFLINPNTQDIISDSNGDPVEGPVPEFASIIVSDDCGCQNRVQGTKGKIQDMRWNSNGFEFVDHVVRENNPLLNPEDVPIVDANTCPLPLVAALIPTEKTVPGECGEDEILRGFILGGIRNFGEPIGTVQAWAGRDDNIPAGYTLADGRQLDTEDWAEVFSAIGYAWGGNGGNFFNLPDLRGTFLRGVDLGEGNDPDANARVAIASGGNTGDAVGSIQEDQMQCFNAQYLQFYSQYISVQQSTAGAAVIVARHSNQYNTLNVNFIDAGCGEPRFGSETRPKNAYVNYIIRTGCPPEIAP